MKQCKFCQTELSEYDQFCPVCGKAQQENSDKKWGIIAIVVSAVVLLGIAAFFLLGALQDGENTTVSGESTVNAELLEKDNYTVDDAVLQENINTTVATLGDQQMTNAQLQIHYWSNALNFVDTYAAYGLVDTTKGLHEQAWDETMNYQQFFLNTAFESWQEIQIFCALADESGYTLPEDMQAELDGMPEALVEMMGTDYESVDAFLQDQLFPGVTQESYLQYMKDYYTYYSYVESLETEFTPTNEQVEAYFAEHEADYAENGVTKEAVSADVRHILIAPEEDTDEGWAAALTSAEALLEEWKNGAATEDSFAELANTHTDDGGSSTTGGLYTDITPTSGYVENFLNWAVDPERIVGDTGIVVSDYGYHIMYYVGGEMAETDWRDTVKSDYINEKVQTLIADAMERWPMSVNYKNIVLGYLSLSGEE